MLQHWSSLSQGRVCLLNALFWLYIMLLPIAAEESYDFIIVGAGSSGAVVANRLSDPPQNFQVLLIEAGGDESPISRIPLNAFTLLPFTHMNWNYKSEPQVNACQGLKEKRTNIPCGKSLGGSSAINCMLYVRGNRRDFDRWASFGNYGWSWKDVYPYFLKSENNLSPNMENDANHGKGGLQAVSDVPYHTNLLNPFFEAVKAFGYPVHDINGEIQCGATTVQTTMLKGSRFSTNAAFLKPVSGRPNLHIKTHAMALRILFDGEKHATGVVYEQYGHKYIAHASKEVIVSAGAMSTPKLLLLSGIGSKAHLDQFNIDTIVNLPGVGQNLHDHVLTTGVTFTVETSDPITTSKIVSPLNLLRYMFFGTGPLTLPAGIDSLFFFKTRYANQADDWPDMYFFLFAFSPLTDLGISIRHLIGFNEETWEKYYVPYLGKNSFTIVPKVLRPKSRGFVKLRSINPYDDPIIDPKYLSHPDDVKLLVEGIKMAVALGNYDSFKYMGAKLIESVVPGCEKFQFRSDDYWTCFARHLASSAFHLAGSAKMGNDTDPMAVVDPELRVRGVKGLRVVDCSIMPEIVSGNNHATAIMIGEKASDMIKKAWQD